MNRGHASGATRRGHGQCPASGLGRTSARAVQGSRRTARHHRRVHRQQGVRPGLSGGHARRPGDPRAKDAELIAAGGMESMSRPHTSFAARQGQAVYREGRGRDGLHDGLWCAFEDWHKASPNTSRRSAACRQADQDRFVDRVSVEPRRRGKATPSPPKSCRSRSAAGRSEDVTRDEGLRFWRRRTIEALTKLRAAFKEVRTVTAGNALKRSARRASKGGGRHARLPSVWGRNRGRS